MAITSTYPIITPKLGDLIVGTQTYTAADPVLDNPTRNFTVQSIADVVQNNGGTTNVIPVFSATGLVDSIITQNAGNVGIDGTVIIRTTGSVDNLKIVSTDTSTGGAPDIVLLADVPAVTGDSHGDILFQGQNGMVPGSGNVLTYTGLFSKMVDKDNNHSSLVMTTHKGNGSGAQALTATFSAKGTNNAATGTLLINPSSVTEVASYNLDVNGDARITGALVDSSANAGTAGQVLSSTVTGTAWITNNSAATYSIGDFAHGGIVFWVDETGQHGLVCAKEDQSSGVRWYAGTYGNTQAKGDGVYSGKANTVIIIAAQVAIGDDGNTYAARICNELQITESGITYGDWYLPSKFELNLMYTNKATINTTASANGGSNFSTGTYWSSTEYDNTYAWYQFFDDGSQNAYNKNITVVDVRAVRAF